MNVSPVASGGLAVALLLGAALPAKADPIPWVFAWSRSPADVKADAPGTGHIELTAEGPTHAAGDSDIVATNLYTHSTATAARKDLFTAKPYTLTLSLTDVASGATGTMVFTGKLDGWVTARGSHLRNTFTGATTQELTLGGHPYTLTIGPYTPPSVPDARNAGSIGAQVSVGGDVTVQQLPEPGTLVLTGLGAALLVIAGRSGASRGRRAGA
jgi:hypothetical protein